MSRLAKLYIGTNTKMYKTPSQAAEHIRRLAALTADIPAGELELFVLPSSLCLPAALDAARGSFIRIGAQNIGCEETGQYTGEISPLMLAELGIDLTMVGHSERRHTFKEADEDEQRKAACAAEHDFTVLLCVGETLEQKEYGVGPEALRTQLKIGLFDIPAQKLGRIWVAYEPVWAIGVRGIPASEGYADDMHRVIKNTLRERYGQPGGEVPILYGGSVNRENAPSLIQMPHIDGLFIGRNAWDADNFNHIIRQALPLFRQRKDGERKAKERLL